MKILSIDPGLTGAIGLLDTATPGTVVVHDMPVVGDEVEVAGLARLLRHLSPDEVVIERVGPMPRDGSVQAFRFGGAYRVATTTISLLEIPARYVTPAAWKRHFGLPGGPEGKEASRGLALQRFPGCATEFKRKKDHNRAEAALLTLYYREKMMIV